MPSLRCSCNNIIDYGQIPCNEEWLLVSDAEFDKTEKSTKVQDLYSKMHHLLKCQNCGNLWVFWDGFNKLPTEYCEVKCNHPDGDTILKPNTGKKYFANLS